MRILYPTLALTILATAATIPAAAQVPAPNLDAGRARATTVCAACHGANGVSVADAIPNLAGQKQAYLEAQLRALKSGARKNAVMNAIAAQLAPEDITNVAAFFSSLPGAGGSSGRKWMLSSSVSARHSSRTTDEASAAGSAKTFFQLALSPGRRTTITV